MRTVKHGNKQYTPMHNLAEQEVTIEVNSKQVLNLISSTFNCKHKENILKGKII